MRTKISFSTILLSLLFIQTVLAQPVFVSNIPNNSYGFFNANGTLYFFHQDSIWKSNGTAAGTVFLKDLGAPGVPIREQGYVIPSAFFFITHSGSTYSLWRSNGTAAGTTSVASYSDIIPLEVYNNEFYYSVLEGGVRKLYKVGTGAPVFLKNLYVTEAELVDGVLALSVTTPTAKELWQTTGTAAGTTLIISFPGIYGIEDLTELNGMIFFEKEVTSDVSELWKTNGTAASTVLVKSFGGSSGDAMDLHDFVKYHGKLLFVESILEIDNLYVTDGTTAGTQLLKSFVIGIDTFVDNLSVANDLVYFKVQTQNAPGSLWLSNGTVAGTQEVHAFNAYNGPRELTTVANHVLYADHTDVNSSGDPLTPNDAYQLWQSDLTEINTKPVEEIFPPATFPQSDNLTNVNNILFFTIPGSGNLKLYKYNPIAPATTTPFFTVVDANTDLDRAWLMEGDTIVVYPGQAISIRYNPIISVGSIQFLLNGPTYRVESSAPYALAGDNSGDYNPWPAAQGTYTLVAREYSGANATGTLLGTHTIHFYVKLSPFPQPPVVNAGTDKSITLPTTSTTLTGTASDPDGSITSTLWSVVSKPAAATVTITSPGSLSTTVTGLTVAGTYVFRLRATDNSGMSSTDDVTVTVLPAGQSVTSFTLINADTDTDLMTISNGSVINFATLPTANINVRVNTNPPTVGSVRITLDALTRIENTAPYSLFGDTGGDYVGETFTNGAHTLTARPYTGANATGTAGTALTVNFTVINSPARISSAPEADLIQTSCFPNPSSDYFNITIQNKEDGKSVVEVYDEAGKLKDRLFEGNVKAGQDLQLNWNASEALPGTYLLKIKTGGQEKIEKLIVY